MKNLYLSTLFLLVFFSCKKSINSAENEVQSKKVFIETKFKTSSVDETLLQDGAQKDEQACITLDNKAGIKCFESVGNTCSKVHSCEPVTALAKSGLYTKEEMDRKFELIKKAYNIKYVY